MTIRYLDLWPAEVNVDEVVKAVYVALTPYAQRATIIGSNVTIDIPETYYPGAPGWSLELAVDIHPDSLILNNPSYGRCLLTFQIDDENHEHYADAYESFLSGRQVELSDPTRIVTLPSAPFLTVKPESYTPPPPPWL